MKRIILVLVALALSALPARAASYSLLSQLQQGFSAHVGASWRGAADDSTDFSDRTFGGAGLSVPLFDGATLSGSFDRYFVDAPLWEARVYINLTPGKR